MFESQVSTYLKDKILEHSTGKTSWTMPATTYLALYADDPTEDDTGTELTGITRPAITWGSASGGVIANSADIILTKTNETTEICTHWGLRDALTSGNLLFFSTSRITSRPSLSTQGQFEDQASLTSPTVRQRELLALQGGQWPSERHF